MHTFVLTRIVDATSDEILRFSQVQKHFAYMEPVQLVNPWVTAEGYAINGNGYINFIIHADDIIKA